MDNAEIWKIIRKYFEDNTNALVRHHIESYNSFFDNDIFQIFKDNNPIRLQVNYDEKNEVYRQECLMYLGGKECNKIHFGKPVIYDDNESHYMFPNEARLRNMTYGMTIHYDVDVEFNDIIENDEDAEIVGGDGIYILDNEEYVQGNHLAGGNEPKKKGKRKQVQEVSTEQSIMIKELTAQSISTDTFGRKIQHRTLTLNNVYLGRFPIMVQSDRCILNSLPKDIRFNMGECKNDLGGYFIIDGKEKTVVSQEKFGNNMLYIRKDSSDHFLYSAEIRSVSENVSKPIRTLAVKIQAPNGTYTQKNVVVAIPNVRKPVPLFIVFRALGILSDKEIIEYCLLDRAKYSQLEELLIPSVYDSGNIFTQQQAFDYIRLLTKRGEMSYVMNILSDYFLPHIGEANFNEKAYFLGHIVLKLLLVYNGNEEATDRDNYKFKRVELVGTLMNELFSEYYKIQLRNIHLKLEENITRNFRSFGKDLYELVLKQHSSVFGERLLEDGFRKAFKGDWGAYSHTKRIGVLQDLNRLSFNSMLSHLRKTNLPLDPTTKIVGPRLLNATQWGMFDPIDTPDGGNIGIHKHLSIMTHVTEHYSREKLMNYLDKKFRIYPLDDYKPLWVSTRTRLFVNGHWYGCIDHPFEMVETMKLHRRLGLIPTYTSITFDIQENTVYFCTDGGRVCRPIFYKDKDTTKMSFENKAFQKLLKEDKLHWNDFVLGTNDKKHVIDTNENKFYNIEDLYEITPEEKKEYGDELINIKRIKMNKAIIDYIDTNETEHSLIALSSDELQDGSHHTHMEIHESLIFGMMCNLINFPENNPASRNLFSCGQSKQACSLYHTNYNMRMDKTAVLLNYGQVPLVKSRYLEFINNEENPYGENVIVAIMCYTGYNVEDAILVNEGSIKRGLFRTSYFSTYETHEEKSKVSNNITQKKIVNIENQNDVIGLKIGYDYSNLDEHGMIKQGTEINDKTVLIGKVSRDSEESDKYLDESVTTKKGQLGIVDKTFITDNEEGTRIAKVRLLEQRIPSIGDKMASRAGQKGTVGLVVKECDMPFTKDGLRPDLIINPHAIPSRMTIGHLIESLIGKAGLLFGGYGDCTAFNNKGSKVQIFGNMLSDLGYHSSGNEVLYNGMDGTQIESEIFMGPNYYMRLKHMVKDKINYRAEGPRTALTRQAVSGRANDGGLRIGEMERDSIISHGASAFLNESMMERGDKYYIAICNKTGMISVYNPEKNIMMSPMADGPLKYIGSLNSQSVAIEQISKYGRDFSIVCVPYTFKLLLQELQTINIQMRIITEDTIDQISNMSFSKNIHSLMHMPKATDKDIVNKLQEMINDKTSTMSTPDVLDITPTQPSLTSLEKGETQNEKEEGMYPMTVVTDYNDIQQELWKDLEERTNLDSPEYRPVSLTPESSTEKQPTLDSPLTPESSTEKQRTFDIASQQMDIPTTNDNISMLEQRANEYSIGDTVTYLKDKLGGRVWSVTDIEGKFLTIELNGTKTNDVSVTPIDEDPIQVVTVMDITPYQSEQSEQSFRQTNIPPSGGNNITYAPIINIDTGGGNVHQGKIEDNKLPKEYENERNNTFNHTVDDTVAHTNNKTPSETPVETLDHSVNNAFSGGSNIIIKKV